MNRATFFGAWLSGGRVERVVLHPLAFSRTDLAVNPQPLFVVWCGPVWGSALPVAAWLFACVMRFRLAFLLRFFAGFCLVANGMYLASALVSPVGDTDDLLRHGSPLWLIVVVGAVFVILGFALWNRLGAKFGFAGQPVDRAAIVTAWVTVLALVVGMLIWSSVE